MSHVTHVIERPTEKSYGGQGVVVRISRDEVYDALWLPATGYIPVDRVTIWYGKTNARGVQYEYVTYSVMAWSVESGAPNKATLAVAKLIYSHFKGKGKVHI